MIFFYFCSVYLILYGQISVYMFNNYSAAYCIFRGYQYTSYTVHCGLQNKNLVSCIM